jgi:ribosomal-protein-alanine N-acetyltransferase
MCAAPTRKFSGRVVRRVNVEREPQRGVSNVRRFRAEDAEAVLTIVEDSPEAAIWSGASYVKFAEEDTSLVLISETDGRISGFLVGRWVGVQGEVLNMAVLASHRRKAEGTALLGAALAEFGRRAVEHVYLEVRESNTRAIAFYEKHGFVKTGLRKGYYRNPDEQAITMGKKL